MKNINDTSSDHTELPTWLRIVVGITVLIVFLGTGIATLLPGLMVGAMATDACSSMPNWVSYWLLGVWPLTMCLSALIPPLLFIFKRRWYWIAGSLAGGITVSLIVYILWFPIVIAVCN